MTTDQAWLTGAGAAALAVALAALLLALRARRRAVRAEELAASLAARLDALESSPAEVPPPAADEAAFVITHVGSPGVHDAAPLAQDIDGRLFADIVARETVVKAASWTAGLRRALSAESRNRIRFAVRQETRRAGRERRSEMKQALREFRARERAGVGGDLGEDVA